MKLPTGLNWPRIGLTLLIFLGLVAAIVAGVKGCKQIEADQDNQLVNAGADKERSATQGGVLNHVEAAHNATANPSDADRNSLCEEYDRNCSKSN
jgi:hypothetical protein